MILTSRRGLRLQYLKKSKSLVQSLQNNDINLAKRIATIPIYISEYKIVCVSENNDINLAKRIATIDQNIHIFFELHHKE